MSQFKKIDSSSEYAGSNDLDSFGSFICDDFDVKEYFINLQQQMKVNEVNKFMNEDSDASLKYVKYCDYLNKHFKNSRDNIKVDVRNMKINCGILYKYNYSDICKLNDDNLFLYLLLLLNDETNYCYVTLLAHYLLDKEIIYKLKSLTLDDDSFNDFKNFLFSKILTRHKLCGGISDVDSLIDDLIRFYSQEYGTATKKRKIKKNAMA